MHMKFEFKNIYYYIVYDIYYNMSNKMFWKNTIKIIIILRMYLLLYEVTRVFERPYLHRILDQLKIVPI